MLQSAVTAALLVALAALLPLAASVELDSADFAGARGTFEGRAGSSEHLPPLPQFTKGAPGAHFSGAFTPSATDGGAASGVVLQRAPQAAAVYGVVLPITGKTGDTVTVTVVEAAAREASYSVTAPVGADGAWKALLKPTAAGGNYTISAACTTCSSKKPETLVDATFGDVWFCSGYEPPSRWPAVA